MTAAKYAPWEDTIIREVYPTSGAFGCVAVLVERGVFSIQQRAAVLGVKCLVPLGGVKPKHRVRYAPEETVGNGPARFRAQWEPLAPEDYAKTLERLTGGYIRV